MILITGTGTGTGTDTCTCTCTCTYAHAHGGCARRARGREVRAQGRRIYMRCARRGFETAERTHEPLVVGEGPQPVLVGRAEEAVLALRRRQSLVLVLVLRLRLWWQLLMLIPGIGAEAGAARDGRRRTLSRDQRPGHGRVSVSTRDERGEGHEAVSSRRPDRITLEQIERGAREVAALGDVVVDEQQRADRPLSPQLARQAQRKRHEGLSRELRHEGEAFTT